ncbi:MAG: hypothetical protein ACR2F6_11670 [Mycobacteriales bacterium]
MSQSHSPPTVSVPPAPARGPRTERGAQGAPPARPGSVKRLVGIVRSIFAGTPGTMRALGIVGVIACLLFGVFALLGLQARSASIGDARTAADQLVRIQNVQNNLVLADANLTSGFLGGGLEPVAERTAYTDSMQAATTGLAAAAGADLRDAAKLGQVNGIVQRYTGLVEGARANNRQGFPIGTAYLREATSLLREKALPTLDSLSQTEQRRVKDAYDASAAATVWLVPALIVCFLILLGILGYLATRIRRLINVPIAVSAVIVLVAGIVGIGVMALAQSKANDARNGAYLATVRAAVARTDGFDARSAEALTLINRGSGAAYEERFKTLAANATPVLAALAGGGSSSEKAMRSTFAAYLARHKQIRAKDDGGNWEGAVELATNPQGRAAFAAFDTASGRALSESSGTLRSDLRSASRPLVPIGIALLAAGAIAAATCWWGISIRLREYQ